MANTLAKEIGEFLDNSIGCNYYCEERSKIYEHALAARLENRGYCSDPYIDYENALTCPVNLRRELECNMVSCKHNNFCKILRREGYIR